MFYASDPQGKGKKKETETEMMGECQIQVQFRASTGPFIVFKF
jgi:hypothetical protein